MFYSLGHPPSFWFFFIKNHVTGYPTHRNLLDMYVLIRRYTSIGIPLLESWCTRTGCPWECVLWFIILFLTAVGGRWGRNVCVFSMYIIQCNGRHSKCIKRKAGPCGRLWRCIGLHVYVRCKRKNKANARHGRDERRDWCHGLWKRWIFFLSKKKYSRSHDVSPLPQQSFV